MERDTSAADGDIEAAMSGATPEEQERWARILGGQAAYEEHIAWLEQELATARKEADFYKKVSLKW